MKLVFSSILTLSALLPLGCDESFAEPEPGELALDESASPAAGRGTITDPNLARYAFTTDAAGGFVGANSDTVRVDAEGLAVRLGQDMLRFTLQSWGRSAQLAVEPAEPRLGACAVEATTRGTDCARRVEQSHGSLTAWVARREGAVEQGWTLNEPPEGTGRVELRLAVTGGELLEVERDAAVLSTHGVKWRYSGLKAWDAEGKDLPAHLERSRDGLSVVVDDTRAVYPIEIDPSIQVTEVKLTPLDPQNYPWPEKYNYGAAIRDIGDYNGDGYGDVAVGAPHDTAYNPDLGVDCPSEGRVYLYFGGPLGVDPLSEQILDPHADGSYAYWSQELDYAFPVGGCHESRFGADIAAADVDFDGKLDLVIGAPGSTAQALPNQDSGRVWAYATNSEGLGYDTAGPIPMFNDGGWSCTNPYQLGTSVDVKNRNPSVSNLGWVSGLVGAPSKNASEEVAYPFIEPVMNWAYYGCAGEYYSDEYAGYGSTYDGFGHRVRVIGDITTNNAIAAPVHGEDDEGRVYVNGHNVNDFFPYQASLDNPFPVANGRFGWDIDDAGDVNGDGFNDLIVGAPGNNGSGENSGSAYLYRSNSAVPFFAADNYVEVLPPGVKAGDEFGAVAGVGDMNLDGYDDLLLGAPGADNGEPESGRAYVVFGGPNGPDVANAVPLSPSEVKKDDFFGHRVSAAGDVNGDQRVDLMVSACDKYMDDGYCSGAVYVFNTDTVTVTDEKPPEAPVLDLKFSPVKSFNFFWAAATGAKFYRLFERQAQGQGYVQIGGDILAPGVEMTMPLHLRFGASYILRACNSGGCTASAPVEVVNSMAKAVGYFKASNTEAMDHFGASVALSADGNTLAVGAFGEDSGVQGIGGDQTNNAVSAAGAVYVFVRVNGVWTQQAYIKASNPGALDTFGVSVALSADGNTLAVGAHGEDSAAAGIDGDQGNDAAVNSGAVYVFTRANNAWSQQAYIKASNPDAGDAFGASVALSADGNTLAAGAYNEDSAALGINGDQASNAVSDAGATYVFVRANGAWSQQAYVKPINPGAGDSFGAKVALSGDGNTLAVGAYREDSSATGTDSWLGFESNSATDAGAVYTFLRANNAWSVGHYLKASNTEAWDNFGYSLALSSDGQTLAVGAYGEDSAAAGIQGNQASNATLGSGAAYVFTKWGPHWYQDAYVKASNPGVNDGFGSNIQLSADGKTLVVTAQNEDSAAVGIGGDQASNAAPDTGAAYVFTPDFTPPQHGWSQRAYVKAPNPGAQDVFGHAVALSADGKTLALGAHFEDSAAKGIGGDKTNNAANNAGAVYLY